MKDSTDFILKPLPHQVIQQVTTAEEREKYFIDFLSQRLPSSDIKEITEELHKTFIFDKLKSQVKKVKPQKKTFLSTRKRKQLGIKTIGLNHQLKYKDFVPLNELWTEYMLQTLGIDDFSELPTSVIDPQWEAVNMKLMRADFHGAKISVIKSKCPSLIGINGILIQETKNAFRVIGIDNVIRTVPKAIVEIKIFLNEKVTLKLFGHDFCMRPAERCIRKFKNRPGRAEL